MISVRFALAAEGASVDRDSNQLSIFNILEGIQAESFPVFMQRIVFVVQLVREEGDENAFQAKFVLTVGNAEITAQMLNVDFMGKPRNRIVVRLGGFVVPQPGTLTFRLTLPNGQVAEYAIATSAVNAPKATQ